MSFWIESSRVRWPSKEADAWWRTSGGTQITCGSLEHGARPPPLRLAEPRPPAAPNAEPGKPSGGQKKLSYHEVRELAALPARIEALEAEQAQLQAEAASPDFYKHSADHIRSVLARIDAIAPELEQAVARWVHLEERS